MKKKKKHPLTLLEIMIVVFLIGLIGSVIGVNMKGSLDEGRAFKSEQGANQIRDILLLEIAKGKSADYVVKNCAALLENSGMIKSVEKALKDGWGQPYHISANGNSDITVSSEKLTDYKRKKRAKLPDAENEEEDA
jgi:type II secretory pathway pseudopilin PulG